MDQSHKPALPAQDLSDHECLALIAGGDRLALRALYRSYHPRLCRFLGRMARRDELIEEVINDCFLVIWQKAADFRGEARASTWIMGIAYRLLLKALRDRGDQPVEEPAAETAWSEPFEAHETREWIAKGMARLSPEHQLTLELAYGMGHSLEEIAAIMACPESTVKARMFHARVKLRNVLPALAQARRHAN